MTARRQRGAALLAAMLTVTLVATFAAASLWQQWRNVEVEMADRQRVQAGWILTGALDWARLILREDRSGVDHLGEPWAVPLQEARLSTFLAADQGNNADTGDADSVFLSGEITDLQARLNLQNLVVVSGTLQDAAVEPFRRLFEVLGLPYSELGRMVENFRFASDIHVDNRNAGRAPLPPRRVEQLAWTGVSPATAAALEPYVTVLPTSSPVNLNTASAEVIHAVGRNFSLADAQRLVAERERQHFRTERDALALLPTGSSFGEGTVSVASRYFEVRGRLRIDNVVIEERSVVFQDEGTRAVRTLQRERGAFESFAPAATRR